MPTRVQEGSAGGSHSSIHEAVISAAEPAPGLDWLDVGCGTGEVLRRLRDRHRPRSLRGADLIDWLDDDLRGEVELDLGPAEATVGGGESVDRLLMVETLEHLEAPWTVLRAAAGRVRPGGVLVASSPNMATLRNRLELMVRGGLTSFRPEIVQHLTPILPHVVNRILREEGFVVSTSHVGPDVMPLTGGRLWDHRIARRFPTLTCVSTVWAARRIA